MHNLIKPLKLATSSTWLSPQDDVTPPADLSLQSPTSYCTSDSSAPPTPTFSFRGHSRFPSSSSSLASLSTSSICEHSDVCGSASKLAMPKLTEEPTEHDESNDGRNDSIHRISTKCMLILSPWSDICPNIPSASLDNSTTHNLVLRTTGLLIESHVYDLESGFFGDEYEIAPSRAVKRQKSVDWPVGGLSSRIGDRFPSFSSRWRHRKPGPTITTSGVPSSGSSRPSSSRSSSLTSNNFPGFDQTEPLHVTPPLSAATDYSAPASPVDVSSPEQTELVYQDALASTPLLPPMMNCLWSDEDQVQSPLQSPTMADPNRTFSTISTLDSTPVLRGVTSPSLSSKPSVASFHRARTATFPLSSDIPLLFINDPTDEWSIKLGHANYSIHPEPYIPEVCNAKSLRQLVTDWELARTNFFRHKHRTIEHYGANSKTFKLTEQKWMEIDAQWRKNNDLATAEASRYSTDAIPITATEPAPLTTMPTLDDPSSEGKFPTLGDQDIVGPMVQVAARPQALPRHGPVVKFFNNIFSRSRSRSATR
jgi:hypothetical protein